MARIRSIKPEFWTSEQVADCSPTARLMFIGLWNFCDDNGVHPDSAKRIKMEIFPADDISTRDIEGYLTELSDAGLIRRYVVDEQPFLIITGWRKHQKIDKPSAKYPLPVGEQSPNARRTVVERHPPDRSRVESKGKESSKGIISGSIRTLNGATRRVDYSTPESRKARWEQKIMAEIGARYPPPEAERIILAYMNDEPWAKGKFEEISAEINQRKTALQ